MSKVKIIKVSFSKLVIKLFFLIVLIFLLFTIYFMSIHCLKGFLNNDLRLGLIGVMFLIFSIYLTNYFGTVIKLFIQYFNNERNRIIILDFEKTHMSIKDKTKGLTILSSDNLSVIEHNISSKDSKNLTSNYNFLNLIDKSENSFIVTSLVMNSSEILNLFPNVKTIIKFNEINFIS